MSKHEKKARAKRIVAMATLAACAGVAMFCLLAVTNWWIDGNNTRAEIDEVEESIEVAEITDGRGENVNPPADPDNDYWNYIKLPLIDVDIAKLKQTNSDTIGFLSVAGTNINYPVVQASDNDYYLDHSFQQRKNQAGWIFMDYRNDATSLGNNTIIYGHGRLDRIMFSSLKNILSSSWVDDPDNYVVRYVTENETMLFRVFSVYTVPAESYYIQTDFHSTSEYEEWLSIMLGRSNHDFGTSVDRNDTILTLSTCRDTKGNRIVLQAKLLVRAERGKITETL